ncbi:MAG TPA: hypothetical protein VND90_11495 [Terracidiphilus sp.]|nr:hypothetical protein [Terracidiphilus sp.]
MPKNLTPLAASILVAALSCTARPAPAQSAASPYSAMAPLAQYLMPSPQAEIALARSAAPPSIADHAEVMVLSPHGYTTAVKGTNGFLCIVERSWGAATNFPEFWNPKIRAPICFNPAAARSFAPIYLQKTALVLAGKSKSEIARAVDSAFSNGQLPALQPGAMCYMMSRRQYLNDDAKNWHSHLMFFVSGKVAATWGANLPGSPVIAASDPEERVTIFMVWVSHWSDGTPAPPINPASR